MGPAGNERYRRVGFILARPHVVTAEDTQLLAVERPHLVGRYGAVEVGEEELDGVRIGIERFGHGDLVLHVTFTEKGRRGRDDRG
jgi:hypothetical protein